MNNKMKDNDKSCTDPQELKDRGYYEGEKAFRNIDPKLYEEFYISHYADGFVKGFLDLLQASLDYEVSCKSDDYEFSEAPEISDYEH